MELRPFKDSIFFLDEMITIIDGLFRIEVVTQFCYVLLSINWLLMLLSTHICIKTTGVSGTNMLQERLKVDLNNTSHWVRELSLSATCLCFNYIVMARLHVRRKYMSSEVTLVADFALVRPERYKTDNKVTFPGCVYARGPSGSRDL